MKNLLEIKDKINVNMQSRIFGMKSKNSAENLDFSLDIESRIC
jgi:hypothetical protein